jgi:hypothetical protein
MKVGFLMSTFIFIFLVGKKTLLKPKLANQILLFFLWAGLGLLFERRGWVRGGGGPVGSRKLGFAHWAGNFDD